MAKVDPQTTHTDPKTKRAPPRLSPRNRRARLKPDRKLASLGDVVLSNRTVNTYDHYNI